MLAGSTTSATVLINTNGVMTTPVMTTPVMTVSVMSTQ
jgi:hypothetical protein